jgi:site-specific DNA-methyltransferase (adenine-specific)
MITLYHGDCLIEMGRIPDGSVDMILADLPYGTTACKWDNVIPFEPLWAHYWRVLKPNGAVVLFGSEPFSSHLRISQIKHYRYDVIWEKDKGSDILNCNRKILSAHENISVFYRKQPCYTPQFYYSKPYIKKQGQCTLGDHLQDKKVKPSDKISDGRRYPKSVIKFTREMHRDKDNHHPTQKPVALLEYLIKTYTIEGETVLDNTMGSGSTGVACVNTGRRFIGIEMDDKYFEIAKNRIEKAQEKLF